MAAVTTAEVATAVYGKSVQPKGTAPAIVLVDPKYAHNVAAAVRAASCYGLKQVWYSGNRVQMEIDAKRRMPREERMRGYAEVELRQCDYIFDHFPNATPVAVELRPNAQSLLDFQHPENPLYVFGPEDGGLQRNTLMHCHQFVVIPTFHCLNLATAIATVLYDRLLKRVMAGLQERLPIGEMLKEDRFWTNFNETNTGLVDSKERE